MTTISDSAGNTYARYEYGAADLAQYWLATNAASNGQLFDFHHGSTEAVDITQLTAQEVTGQGPLAIRRQRQPDPITPLHFCTGGVFMSISTD